AQRDKLGSFFGRLAMNKGKVVRFPIKSSERWKNRLGKRAAACLVTDRWLQFPENSEPLPDGDYMFINVMTRPDGENVRRICQLCVSKQDLIRAIKSVD